jgi:SDR family mycofactocin-dependent oxidoreductase
MGKLDGRVAFITGAARGQGRSHAIKLAQEGADIIAVDLCRQVDSVPYAMSTPDDLRETVEAVEAEGRRIVARPADVRDVPALRKAVDEGVAELGGLDIVIANAAIAPTTSTGIEQEWDDVLDVNVTGVYNTVEVSLPALRERGRGSIIVISSIAGMTGAGGNSRGMLAYTASKTAVIGLAKAWANYLSSDNIRVNTVAMAGVKTPMLMNASVAQYIKEHPEFVKEGGNPLGVQAVEPIDISNAIAFLVSDDARYITGVTLPVDAGALIKW